MKILLILCFLITGCYGKVDTLPKDPHWKYNQHVRYEVPEFYQLVCNGYGTVIARWTEGSHVMYSVQPDIQTNPDGTDNYECFNVMNNFHIGFDQ